MKTAWIAFGLITVLLCSCATTPPPPKNAPRHDALPKTLRLTYSGALDGGCTEYVLEDTYVVRRVYRGGGVSGMKEKLVDTKYFVPTRAQWLAFWKRVNQMQIWTWKKSYDPQDIGEVIYDGTSWHLAIEYRDRKIDTGGVNAGPKPGQPQKTSTDWDVWNKELDEAMSILVPYREE